MQDRLREGARISGLGVERPVLKWRKAWQVRVLLVAEGKNSARVRIWVFWQAPRGVVVGRTLKFSRNVLYNPSEHKNS